MSGVWIAYHSNGILAELTRYSYGKKLGLSESRNEAGMPTSVLRYSDDRLHGPCVWIDNEQNTSRQELYLYDTLLVSFSRTPNKAETHCYASGRFYNKKYDLQIDWDENCQDFRVGRVIDAYKQGRWTFFLNHLEQALGSREVVYEKGTIVSR